MELLSDSILQGTRYLGAGMAAVSLIGSGMGIGVIFGCLMLAFIRNARLRKDLLVFTFLGFALTEAVGLLGLMMSFLILFM